MKFDFKRTLQVFFIVLLTGFMTGCSVKIGYVSVVPRTSPVPAKIKRTLNIYVENVKDIFTIQVCGQKSLIISEFRSSVKDALKEAFSSSFEQVNFTDKIIDNELTLHVYRIEPYCKIKRSEEHYSSNGYSSTIDYLGSAFQYQATLYDRGKELSKADDVAVSTDEGRSIDSRIFMEGLQKAIEMIHETIVITPDLAYKLK
jgi:hypothetical protein